MSVVLVDESAAVDAMTLAPMWKVLVDTSRHVDPSRHVNPLPPPAKLVSSLLAAKLDGVRFSALLRC